jgi:hypothetical protein
MIAGIGLLGGLYEYSYNFVCKSQFWQLIAIYVGVQIWSLNLSMPMVNFLMPI